MQIIKPYIIYFSFFCLIFNNLFVFANHINKKPPAPYSNNAGKNSKVTLNGEFSADMTFVSNYISYGTSNTNNLPALQGTLSYSIPSGFYISLWGSNNIIDGWKQSLELYPSIGWTKQKDKWSWYILGAFDTYFFRPAGINPSYFEFEGALSHDLPKVTISLGMTYAPNYYAVAGQTFYPFVRFNIPLQYNFDVHMQYTYASMQNNEQYGIPDYSSIRLGIKKSNFLRELDVGLYFYDTNISPSQCFPVGPEMKPLVNACGPGVFVMITHQFK